MARPNENEMVELGPWTRGANNVTPEDSIPGGSARVLENVDVYSTGELRRRKGSTAVFAVAGGAWGFWSNGNYALYRTGDKLYHYTPEASATLILTGLPLDCEMSYEEVNADIYVSTGFDAYRIHPLTDTATQWGVEAPPGQPTLAASASGGLDAGRYQVAITYMFASREESGTGQAAEVDVAQGGGIDLSAIPQPTQVGVTSISIYVSRAGGEELLFYRTVPAGTTSYTIVKQALTKPLRTQFMSRIPALQHATISAGRLWGAVDNFFVWSEPLYFGQTKLATNYLAFAATINMVSGVNKDAITTGYFIGAGTKTYFIPGSDPTKFNSVVAAHAGVIPGSLVHVPGSSLDERLQLNDQLYPLWVNTDGFVCLGMPNGTITSLTEGKYAMAVGGKAHAFFRMHTGVRQAVFAMQQPAQAGALRITDSASATVIRNGIEI